MRDRFLSFSPPDLGEEEIAEVVDTLRSDWITTGPKVKRFEADFATYVGAESALALNSCTAALHVALVVAGVGPGDIVVSTPMTFSSSIHVIEHTGARALLVDVEPDTLNIDPARVEAALIESGGKAKAILPVHLHGHPADMEPILESARRHHVAVIEDAAHSLPARYRGRLIGAPDPAFPEVTDMVAYSFYATKNVTTGEGGMLTGTTADIDRSRVWALHGMSRDAHNRYGAGGSWRYDVEVAGFKYNMSDIQAALGIHQLRRLERMQERRHQIVSCYEEAFGRLEAIELPRARSDVDAAWHIYAIRLNLDRMKIGRAEFIDQLAERNIGTSVHFIPVHLMSYYRDRYGYRPDDFPIANAQFERLVSLPLSPRMSDDDVADVIDAVADVASAALR
jgi:dTDP-4-amino-4,6-dideoxygalactose transaminase